MATMHHRASTLRWLRENKSITDIERKSQNQINRRKHECRQYDSITTDVIAFEILTRLPVKGLLKFKSVCKSWRALLSEPTFIAAHLKRSRENPKLVFVALSHKPFCRGISMYTYEEGRKKSRFLFMEEYSAVQRYLFPPHRCNGLLLLNTQTQLVVCNPSTKESVALPAFRHNYGALEDGTSNFTAAFGYVESMNVYKVAWYFYRSRNVEEKTFDLGFEVITLVTSDFSWRDIDDPPYPIGISVCPKPVGEVIYFNTDNRLHQDSPKALLCFNLKDEMFRVVDPPHRCPNIDYGNIRIFNLEGNPCFIHWSQDRTEYKMWISKDFDEHVWVPTFSFDLPHPPLRFVLPVALRRGKLLLQMNDEVQRLECYDPQSKVFDPVICIAKDVAFYNEHNGGLHVFDERAALVAVNYVESLVPIRPKS